MGKAKARTSAPKKVASRSATKPAAKPATKPAHTAPELVPEVAGSQGDHERFLPEAGALAERDVRPFRLDPSLAYHNVQRGVDALSALFDRIRVELPAVDVEQIRTLPNLALALCFAASQVDRGGGTSKQLAEPLRRAYALRETMLTSAKALALAGAVPSREVEKIEEGRGSLDAAQDNIDLAALFQKHAAAVRGKSPITAVHVTEASKLGTDLLKVLRPGTAKRDRAPTGTLKQAIDTRNRMATLLATRHELARRVAHWFWGDAADKQVPPLQARVAAKRKAPKVAAPPKGDAGKKGEPGKAAP